MTTRVLFLILALCIYIPVEVMLNFPYWVAFLGGIAVGIGSSILSDVYRTYIR